MNLSSPLTVLYNRETRDVRPSSNQKGAISVTVCGWHMRISLCIRIARMLWMDFRLEGTRRIVNLLTFMLRSLKAERCDFGGKIAPALEPFQNKVSTLVSLL